MTLGVDSWGSPRRAGPNGRLHRNRRMAGKPPRLQPWNFHSPSRRRPVTLTRDTASDPKFVSKLLRIGRHVRTLATI